MKTRKVNKRLSKLDELLADLSKGYAKGALHVRAAVEGAKVAVAHLRATINSPAPPSSSQTPAAAEKSGASRVASKSAASKPGKRKLSPEHRRAIQEGMRRRAAAKKASLPAEKGSTKKNRPASRKRAAAAPL